MPALSAAMIEASNVRQVAPPEASQQFRENQEDQLEVGMEVSTWKTFV